MHHIHAQSDADRLGYAVQQQAGQHDAHEHDGVAGYEYGDVHHDVSALEQAECEGEQGREQHHALVARRHGLFDWGLLVRRAVLRPRDVGRHGYRCCLVATCRGFLSLALLLAKSCFVLVLFVREQQGGGKGQHRGGYLLHGPLEEAYEQRDGASGSHVQAEGGKDVPRSLVHEAAHP